MTSFMILWEYSHFLDDLYHTTLSIVLHSSCRFMVVIWTEFCEMTCITSMCVLSPVMMFTVCARYAVYQHRYVCCVLFPSALVYYVLMCALFFTVFCELVIVLILCSLCTGACTEPTLRETTGMPFSHCPLQLRHLSQRKNNHRCIICLSRIAAPWRWP